MNKILHCIANIDNDYQFNYKNSQWSPEVIIFNQELKHSLSIIVFIIAIVFMISTQSFALHPLITDDTGTQGKGKFELEMGFQYDHDDFRWVDTHPESIMQSAAVGQNNFGRVLYRDDSNTFTVTLSYGIIDNLDVIIGLPFANVKTKEKRTYFDQPFQFVSAKSTSTSSGLTDISAEIKWKFFEYSVISLALKPGIVFPSGDAYRGLGVGRFGGYGYFITTLNFSPVIMHINLGYIRNQNILREREDIWHASLAFEFWLVRDYLRLVANCAVEPNRHKWSYMPDVIVDGGIVVSPTENVDIDLGFKYRFSRKGTQFPGADYNPPAGIATRPDFSVLGALTMRFGSGRAQKIEP